MKLFMKVMGEIVIRTFLENLEFIFIIGMGGWGAEITSEGQERYLDCFLGESFI